ncbi:MAG: tyrosinase family protein [Vicinamibacterales bacterium]
MRGSVLVLAASLVLAQTPAPEGIVFTSETMRNDGSDVQQITDNPWEAGTPVWQPTTRASVRSAAQSAASPRRPSGGAAVRVRKSVAALSATERRDFVDAVLALKAARSPHNPSLSYYDQFVQWHKERYVCRVDQPPPGTHTMPMVHTGPMFLPWHRELLNRFETALREVSGKDVTLPYWDWTDPGSIDPNNANAVFRDDFMGGDGSPDEQYAVTTGPFKKGTWRLNVQPEGVTWASAATAYLSRHLGRPETLPTRAQVEAVLAAEEYDAAPFNIESDPAKSFRNAIEGNGEGSAMRCGPDGWMAFESMLGVTPLTGSGPNTMHNLVHVWVAGIITPAAVRPRLRGTMFLSTSPNDPVFFLHHANVDRLWAEWQAAHPGKTYAPSTGHEGNNADSAMAPFGVSPRDVERVTAIGYRYR